MPYIKKERRAEIDSGALPEDAGELNYAITMKAIHDTSSANGDDELSKRLVEMCVDYVQRKGGRYQHYNDALGALTGASREMARRAPKRVAPYVRIQHAIVRFYEWHVIPYEDTKRLENGDINYARPPYSVSRRADP